MSAPSENTARRSGVPAKLYPPDSAKANEGCVLPFTLLPQPSKPSATPRSVRPRPGGGSAGGAAETSSLAPTGYALGGGGTADATTGGDANGGGDGGGVI